MDSINQSNKLIKCDFKQMPVGRATVTGSLYMIFLTTLTTYLVFGEVLNLSVLISYKTNRMLIQETI